MATVGSQAVTFDVQYGDGRRSRLTTFFRYFTALPHLLILGVWAYAVYFVAFLQWFVAVFTGKRNEGLWRFQRDWLAYASRVESYVYLVHDVWPTVGSQWGDEPVAFDHRYEQPANRLTSFFRPIWMLPAVIVGYVIGIGAMAVLFVTWFAILFTGKVPRGMFGFLVRVLRFGLNLGAYAMLMTDTYPRYERSAPTGTLPSGDGAATRAVMPPPPSGDPLADPWPPPTV